MLKLFFIACFSAICLSAVAQSGKDNSVPVFFEKAWLHTDRDMYGQGEDIWFKAYVVNAQDNTSINYSHNLYVELIGPQARLVKRETIRLEEGLGNGDFKLSDTISPGRYRIRAYTNWMRNFGDNFVFEKYITILHASNANPATVSNRASATTTPNPATILTLTVRFYPEGGSLVDGISSVIGVKAEDASGNGIAVEGKVVDNAGQTMAAFNCDSLGFGSFILQPQAGQHYQSLVMIEGAQQHYTMPEIQERGVRLHVNTEADTVKVTVSASPTRPGGHVYLVARHGGKSYVRQTVLLNNNGGSGAMITVANNKLPEGITALTLYDEQNQPQCERLVYIHHPDQVKLAIATDQTVYAPKGEIKVRLKLNSKEKASLSMAAVTTDIPVPAESILSYLNLQSEIRGTIEEPNRYFDTTNIDRFKQLDELLLTQGWRGFVWKKMADTTLNISYQPEQGITITGRVRRILTDKPLAGISITMRAPQAEGQKLFWATTDSTGRFAIGDTKFYGYQYISFTSRKSDKINGDGESKGSSGGHIQVDSLLRDTLPITKIKEFTAHRSLLTLPDSFIFNIPKNRQLKEVKIKAVKSYTIPPENRNITLAEQKDYGNLLQYLLYTIPEAHAVSDSIRGIVLKDNNIPPHQNDIGIVGSYVDHSPMDRTKYPSDFLLLPMGNVLKLTIKRWYDWQLLLRLSVSLVLRPGSLHVKDFFDNTMADMVGYYKAREFYKPRFEDPNNIDLRTNTIHWEPNITTDKNGEATVSFYNTAQTGKNRIIVEGITDKGIPLVTTINYEVK